VSELTNDPSVPVERKCQDCGKNLGEGELYRWGETPLCFECKKPRIIATREKNEEWLLGNFAVYKTSILRSIFGGSGRTPYGMLATNKRLVIFDPNAKKNREIIQEKVRQNKDLVEEVGRMRKSKDFAALLGIPFYGVLGYYLFRSLRGDFEERDLSLASILVSLGSGRQMSGDEVAVLCSLDKTYDITQQRPPLRFYQLGIQKAFAPGWWKMEDERGTRYLIGFNAHDFCLFYFEHFCPSTSR